MHKIINWRAAVALKLAALVALWVSFDRGWRFGDAPANAKDQPPAAPETEVKKSDKDGPKSAASSAPEGKSEEGSDSAKAPSKVRKSFIANLLELPTLDPDGIRKEELEKYLELAERKRRQVEDRLEILKKREGQLKGLESSIDDKLQRLDEERQYLKATLQNEKTLKGERIDRLVATYSKMEPKKAAPVFEKMDRDLVVELFKQLPQKQVTVILESMNADKSVQLTEYYGRVRSAREYDLLKEMNESLRLQFQDCKGAP